MDTKPSFQNSNTFTKPRMTKNSEHVFYASLPLALTGTPGNASVVRYHLHSREDGERSIPLCLLTWLLTWACRRVKTTTPGVPLLVDRSVDTTTPDGATLGNNGDVHCDPRMAAQSVGMGRIRYGALHTPVRRAARRSGARLDILPARARRCLPSGNAATLHCTRSGRAKQLRTPAALPGALHAAQESTPPQLRERHAQPHDGRSNDHAFPLSHCEAHQQSWQPTHRLRHCLARNS
jgi:hypothetical protein